MVAYALSNIEKYTVHIRIWRANDEVEYLSEKEFSSLMQAHVYVYKLYKSGVQKHCIEVRKVTIEHIEIPNEPDSEDE